MLHSPETKEIQKEARQGHSNIFERYPSVPDFFKMRNSNSFKPKDFDSIANEQKRME